MNYISAEQFLKQSEKIQKAFMDWWKPEKYNLFIWDAKGHRVRAYEKVIT